MAAERGASPSAQAEVQRKRDLNLLLDVAPIALPAITALLQLATCCEFEERDDEAVDLLLAALDAHAVPHTFATVLGADSPELQQLSERVQLVLRGAAVPHCCMPYAAVVRHVNHGASVVLSTNLGTSPAWQMPRRVNWRSKCVLVGCINSV